MKSNKGFTLIELLVVIAIIALLSSIVLASLSTARAKSRDVRRLADAKQLMLAIDMYYDANGSYPSAGLPVYGSTGAYGAKLFSVSQDPSWDATLAPLLRPYISKLPHDPLSGDPWPFQFFYFAEGQSTCPESQGHALIILATEVTLYNGMIPYTLGQGGSKARYCIVSS